MRYKTQPKSGTNCGLFAMLRKYDAPKVTGKHALAGICNAARRRGTPWGAGFTVLDAPTEDLGRFKVKVLVEDEKTLEEVKALLTEKGFQIVEEQPLGQESNFKLWEALINADKLQLVLAIREIHFKMHTDHIRARFISAGQFSETWKGIGWPWEIAEKYHLVKREGDLWICHSRMPTNFLADPMRAHPFHMVDVSVAHNGEDAADGVHSEFLATHGELSFVGSDSEKIALMLNHLVHIEGLTFEQAMAILAPPPEQYWDMIRFQEGDLRLRDLLYRYRGAQLDGSYAVIVGYTTGDDVFVGGTVQLRPLEMGEDDKYIYLASEQGQIREVSPYANTWSCRHQRRVLASMKQGIVHDGRGSDRKHFFRPKPIPPRYVGVPISVRGMGSEQAAHVVREANNGGVVAIKTPGGTNYLGVGMPQGTNLSVIGLGGDSVGKLAGPDKTIHVMGDAQDDAFDAAQCNVTAHGDLGSVPLYAYQGRKAFIRGSGGDRAMLLMRDLGEGPLAIWGGRLQDFAGEFMAAGTGVVLGVDALDTDYTGPLVGSYLMTGAVGNSRIYVRGDVGFPSIGLQPDSHEIVSELEQAVVEGLIDERTVRRLQRETSLTWWELKDAIPSEVAERLAHLFHHRYLRELDVQKRVLDGIGDSSKRELSTGSLLDGTNGDARVVQGILDFGREFDIPKVTIDRLLASSYTIVSVVQNK